MNDDLLIDSGSPRVRRWMKVGLVLVGIGLMGQVVFQHTAIKWITLVAMFVGLGMLLIPLTKAPVRRGAQEKDGSGDADGEREDGGAGQGFRS